MSEPFLSEIKIIAFNFPPRGWAFCNGQLLPIQQNMGLFSLLGTTYGGDGRQTFGLPDLRDRVPIHFGAGFTLGQKGGEQAHTLNINELPTHTHVLSASASDASTNVPDTNTILARTLGNTYTNPANLTAMNASALANVGGSQAHLNMQPFLVLNFVIALQGIFPSQT